jgi:hypothetical protein
MTKEMKPVAEGNFSKTPFAHILIYLLERKMSGTLDIRHEKAKVRVYVRDGKPAKVQTNVKKRELGHVLLLLKAVTEAQLAEAQKQIETTGGLVGQTLIEMGHIDIDTLVIGLRRQMLLKLTDVFALNTGDYAFYEKTNMLTGFGPDEVFPIHPFPVIMAGLRTYAERLNLDPMLEPIKQGWLTINDDMEIIRSFRLNGREKQVVGLLLSGPRPFPEITESGIWDRKVAKYVLYAMLITKQLIIHSEFPSQQAGGDSRSLSSAPPPPKRTGDPKIDSLRDTITGKAALIGTQNYYEMLNLSTEARIEDIRKAYFIMAKTFHPDRLPTALKTELAETVQYLFSNLSEAHTVLSDPTTRETYDRALGNLPESDEETDLSSQMEVRDALEAESLFQRALVFLNKQELATAQDLVDRAQILSPKEGEYLALSTHLKVLERPQDTDLEDLEKKLRQASADCPKSEGVTFYLADVLKRSQKFSEAKLYYKKTLILNPHNIQAAREIRLIEMRTKRGDDKPKGGLLKKLFK